MLDGQEKITDESLILDAINGKASAFGLLYNKYNVQIYRFIYLKVSHREEAEDLTHQVFLNAWQNIKNYRFKGFPFSSWLYQIARNQVIDHYRTKKDVSDIENIEEPETLGSSLSEKLDLDMEIEIVKKAIPKLKPEQQDIIILRFVDDLSPKEVSIALKRPESTIRVLQHRAIKNLQKIINKSNTNQNNK